MPSWLNDAIDGRRYSRRAKGKYETSYGSCKAYNTAYALDAELYGVPINARCKKVLLLWHNAFTQAGISRDGLPTPTSIDASNACSLEGNGGWRR